MELAARVLGVGMTANCSCAGGFFRSRNLLGTFSGPVIVCNNSLEPTRRKIIVPGISFVDLNLVILEILLNSFG